MVSCGFFDDSGKNTRMSKKQEKLIAKTGDRGRRTPGSGNKSIKGDVIKPSPHSFYRGRKYEAKTTDKTQITIKRDWLVKLEREAATAHEEPVFVFGFEGSKLVNVNWGAVPLERLEELFQIEREYLEGKE